MNIKDLVVGQTCEMRKTFTEEDVKFFSVLSNDTNPIHLDSEYASKSIFKKQIVHGYLSSSLISAIIGTKMPGPGSIYLHQDLNFRRPVFIGEEVRAEVTVQDINIEKSTVTLQTNCYNPNNEITVEGSAIIKLKNNMKRLAIIGTRDLAYQITHFVTSDNQFDVVGYIDDLEPKGKLINNRPVLGSVSEAEMLYKDNAFDCVLIGIGYSRFDLRKSVYETLKGKVPFATFVHSTCYVDPTSKIGEGCVVYPRCIIDMNADIRPNVFINWGSGIGHDAIMHSHSFIAANVLIAGLSEVGERCMIGNGTTFIDHIHVCDDVTIGGGATVVKNITESGVYVGTPAKMLKPRELSNCGGGYSLLKTNLLRVAA